MHHSSILQGFASKYRDLVREAERRFPDAPIAFSGEATPKRTGWFEVTVDGKLVFSSKAGMGKFNTSEKMERVMKTIGAELEAKKQVEI